VRAKVFLIPLLLSLSCVFGGRGGKVDGVLLVTIDTCRAGRLGCYGASRSTTPVLDRLAAGGIQFATCITQVPTTLASHTTILSSLYPRSHGVPRNGFGVPTNVRTIAQIFHDEGFRTAAFVGAFPLNHAFGLDRGFDTYDDETDTSPNGGELERRADRVAERAAAWLRAVGDKPFFLWVHFFDPHWPYDPPPPYGRIRRPPESAYDPTSLSDMMAIRFRNVPFGERDEEAFRAAYDGEIAFADRRLGELLDALPAGRRRRTLVAVAGDHGEGFGEHGYFFDHGAVLWESAVSVPLILHAPLLFPEPRLVGAPVRLLDVAPTLLEAAGIGRPSCFEGESLLGAARGEIAGRVAFSEASKPWNVEVQGEYQNKYKAKAVRDGRWKLVVVPFRDRKVLVDLEEDPAEMRNVIAREPEREARLEKMLVDWMRERDPGYRSDDLTVGDAIREKLRALGYSQ